METRMQENVLTLTTQSLNPGALAAFTRVSRWDEVDQAIDVAFSSGGAVRLATEVEVDSPRSGLVRQDAIEMLALPGRYRLVVSPFKKLGERSNRRDWWQPGDETFRGTEKFGDEEVDSRMVCHDVRVAKELLAEFVAERQITKRLIDSTLSVWTPKPRA